ncbi:MAG: hypothetical protein AAB547_03015 [Patescibacteria group bacterium]
MKTIAPEQNWKAARNTKEVRGGDPVSDAGILALFSKKEQKEIKYKQRVLSSLAYFIGKDFEIPVELNAPGAGWHWDFKENKIRIDPKDLLEKPLDYLRYLVCHEGSHRRISRTDFIPLETWQQPGFSFMMNAIEDPRVDNFVAENYPKFKQFSQTFHDVEMENLKKKYQEASKERLGHQPRFMRAGFEYLRLWYKETQGQAGEISTSLPQEVRQVVQKTIASARDSWWRYPLKREADADESLINKYAKVSYEINLDEVWPAFKKLVDEDMKDQRVQEALTDMQLSEQQKGKGQGVPQPLKDSLTPQQQRELEDAIDKAIESAAEAEADREAKKEREKNKGETGVSEGESTKGSEQGEGHPQAGRVGRPIDLDSLSEGLKQKIKEFIDLFPPEKQKELQERAEQELRELEREMNEALEGKLSENPEKMAQQAASEKPESERAISIPREPQTDFEREQDKQRQKDLEQYRDILEKTLRKDANVYERYRGEVLPMIESLENDLREIFVARRASRWKSGFKTGKRIDIKTRIQEKAKGISAVESKAWQKRELPTEKDYAISILVDLSGSMAHGGKIQETFKALIVLAEALNKLSIKVEILGFNDRFYEYQAFSKDMDRETRERMGGMIEETVVASQGGGGHASNQTDTGWATKLASERLARQQAGEKFLITLTDGVPQESPAHSGAEYRLDRVVNHIMRESDQKLIGLGIGSGTEHVKKYYPNNLANIDAKEMAAKLADAIREMIVNYQRF